MTIDFEIIEKENIGTLKFPHSEVIETLLQRKKKKLERAPLGNLEHSKFKFTLKMIDQKKMVETTVWALTDLSVVLKRSWNQLIEF
jgi:hypothetical protein